MDKSVINEIFEFDFNLPIRNINIGKGKEFETINEALNSIKEKARVNLIINGGVYNENVIIDMPYISIINNSSEDVVIIYDRANGHIEKEKSFGTDKTATFTLTENAKQFYAKNITFVNSYNIDDLNRKQVQAVAFQSLADMVFLENCKFIARQDTLYLRGASKGQFEKTAKNARVYLKKCYVEGTVDFIFGDATAYFDKCKLKMVYNKNGGHFTAPNTTIYNIGFVFSECELIVDDKFSLKDCLKIDLGRPWQCDKDYPNYASNSVFINCKMPNILLDKGFSKWDKNTVENKIRFIEYGDYNLDSRADFVKIINKEQAEKFSLKNVFRKKNECVKAADITLDRYIIELPLCEECKLNAISLPINCIDEIEFVSLNEKVASVDKNGKIKALSEGKTKIFAINKYGLSSYASLYVTPKRTEIPKIKNISIKREENVLKAVYDYENQNDNVIDKAKIRWSYIIDKNNEKFIIKEGVGEHFLCYEIRDYDFGGKICIDVYPATKTTYNEYGKGISYIYNLDGENSLDIYRTNFCDKENWNFEKEWVYLEKDNNKFITGNCKNDEPCRLTYKNNIFDFYFNGRFRFNPERKGLTSEGYFNIYFNFEKDNYYLLKIDRGSNTKSLKLYLYKNNEVIDKDETSLKNNICQNAGENNPYFKVEIIKKSNLIEVYFYIEGNNKYLSKLSFFDKNSLKSGNLVFETNGDDKVVLIDNITIKNMR